MSTKADDLSGQVMARDGELPPVWESLDLKLELLDKMVSGGDGDEGLVKPLQSNENVDGKFCHRDKRGVCFFHQEGRGEIGIEVANLC